MSEGAAHGTKSDNVGKFAFTLAEVLITLAIIGVVAALTIPTLVAQNQQRGWDTASTVFERKLDEALKIMNAQGTLAGYRTTEEFVGELSKHLKIVKICDNVTDCFEDKIESSTVIDVVRGEDASEDGDMTKIKTASDLGQKDWGTDAVGFQLNNVTTGIIAYNPECKEDRYNNTFSGTSCVAVIYDTSGYAKPNSLNKDVRTVNANYGGCLFKIDGACATKVIPNVTPMTYAECAGENATSPGNITPAGTEANALGIKECYYDNDYWAGAVKACGGKISTRHQLEDIASYIYGTTISSTVQYNVTRDDNKAASLGLPPKSGSSNVYWSGCNEYSYSTAYGTRFGTSEVYWTSLSRNNSDWQVVCLE